jgi:predicted dehydrogenase
MVRVGIAGIGFMGVTHYRAYRRVEGAEVAAIFTRNRRKLQGDWSDVRGNFGDAGGVEDLGDIRRHADLDALLQDPDLDLVDVCLPSHLHRDVVVRALEAGKHVLVEKPIALTVDDADAMIAAAEQHDRLLMVAQVLRFWPEFALLKEIAASNRYGKLRGVHFKRVIASPDWSEDNWFSDPAKTGGAVVDLHIHDTDFVRFLCGPPTAVTATGVASTRGELDYLVTQYHYGGRNLCVTAQSGAIAMKGLEFEHGYDAYFERATLKHNSSTTPTVEAYLADGSQETLPVSETDAFEAQLQAVTAAVAKGKVTEILAARSARDSLATVLAEAKSARCGRRTEL